MKKMIQYIALTIHVVKLNILSSMEYRFTFLSQIIGMIINDVVLLFMWGVLFSKFPSINGWSVQDTMLLFSVGMTNFGIYRIFGGNVEDLSHNITHGELDYFLTLPKSVLWQASTAKTNISAIGDFFFGLILFFFLGFNLQQFAIFILLSLLTALILYNFMVILQSLGFFIGNFEESADRIFHLLLGLSLYPSTIFSGALKFIALVIVPVFFITWVPVDIVKIFQWHKLGWLLGFWLLTLFLALFIFNRGLRRYESGNLINVKM